MAHNDFARWSGEWFPETVPTARDMRALDLAASKTIDGDNGGTWAPTKPIIVGGAGLKLNAGAFGNANSIEGGVVTSSGGRLVLADNDFPLVSPSRTRSIVVPLQTMRFDEVNAYQVEIAAGALGGITFPYGSTGGFFPQLAIPSRSFHRGATLLSASLSFRVGFRHSTVPATMPAFRLTRTERTRNTLTGGEDFLAAGFKALAVPGTADLYYAGGNAQTITMTCDQNNTALDPATYTYLLLIRPEPTGLNDIFHSLTLNFSAIADLRFE